MELCKLVQIKELHTSLYHPQSSGHGKRFNGTFISMLDTSPEKNKSFWKDLVSTLVHAYNFTRNNATEFNPYFVMYGCKPRLPIDLYFGIQIADLCNTTSTKFLQQLQDRLKWAYKVVQEIGESGNKDTKRGMIVSIAVLNVNQVIQYCWDQCLQGLT